MGCAQRPASAPPDAPAATGASGAHAGGRQVEAASETAGGAAPQRADATPTAASAWADALAAALDAHRLAHPGDAARLPTHWGADAPRFVGPEGPLPGLAELRRLCDAMPDEGLVPAAHGCEALPVAESAAGVETGVATTEVLRARATQEIAAHAVVLRYADSLGALTPPRSNRKVIHRPRNLPVPPEAAADGGPEGERRLLIGRVLARLAQAPLAEVLGALQPGAGQYAALKAAAARYRAWDEAGGFGPTLPAWKGMKRDAKGPAVLALRARLAAEGFESAPAEGAAAVYDATLEEALAQYRRVHLLDGRATIDRLLFRTLSRTAAEKRRWLREALTAWRAAPRRGGTYIQVNIPDFHLEYWREDARAWRTRVVVGSAKRDEENELPNATPVMASKIHTIIYKPFWNVPERILEEEILKGESFWDESDKAARVAELGYELVDAGTPKARVRQLPGQGNALGLVKFQFRNEHAVYLHDTPAKAVFSRTRRALSHGCVRVQHPLELARLLLTDDGQYRGRDERRWLADEEPTPVILKKSVPVYLDYILARIDDEGRLIFLPDIYDQRSPPRKRRRRK